MKKGSHHSSDSLLQIHYAMKLVWKRRGFREREEIRERVRQWHMENANWPKRRRPLRTARIIFP